MEEAVGLLLWLDRWRTSSLPRGLQPLKDVLQELVPQRLGKDARIADYEEPKLTETMEDMHTEDLPMLLAEYVSACALYNERVTDMGLRRQNMLACRERMARFVKRLAGLMANEKVADEWIIKVDLALTPESQRPRQSAEEARSLKMAIKRQIKELTDSLEFPLCYVANLKSLSEEGNPWLAGEDEEECRAFWFNVIDLALYDAVENLTYIGTEIDALQHLIEQPPASEAPPPRRPLQVQTFRTADELHKFYKAQVFQVPYELPSQSLAEVAAKEMAYEVGQLGEAQKRTQKHADASSDSEPDEAAEQKLRDWDDWKDENPRGAGNQGVNRG